LAENGGKLKDSSRKFFAKTFCANPPWPINNFEMHKTWANVGLAGFTFAKKSLH